VSKPSITYLENLSAIILRVPVDEGDVHGYLSLRIDDPDNYGLYAWVTEEEGKLPQFSPIARLLRDLVEKAGIKFEILGDGDGPFPSWVRPDAP
jgi:hypothetical protein